MDHSIFEDLSSAPGLIEEPTLIVAALCGRMTTLAMIEEEVHRKIQGSNLAIIDNCGHLIPLEQPEKLAEFIVGFSTHLPGSETEVGLPVPEVKCNRGIRQVL